MSRFGPEPATTRALALARPGATPHRPSTLALVVGFGAVYLIWGSTYLAIRIAIETIPPFTMAGSRFFLAGAVLYLWARVYRGAPAPTREHWRNAAVVGALLLFCGNGSVVWAEQWVASGSVALLVGMVPVWMVGADWLWGRGRRPGRLLIAGLAWGLFGVGLLASPAGFGSENPRGLLGGLAVMVGGMAWAAGSIRSKRMALPAEPGLATSMAMLWGGVLLLLAAGVSGELARLDASAFSVRSELAVLYLVVFGSLIAFSTYVWLLSVTTPARLATYAYVNPVVALLLGWAFAGEAITPRTLLAAFVILSAVVVNTQRGS